jgi:branched-chain amino acid transport system substrate-binding protein
MTMTRRSFGLTSAALAAAMAGIAPRGALADGGPITIGFTGPLSGGAALYGKNCLTGLQMAAEEINAKGGLDLGGAKSKIEIVSLDDRYSPSEAAQNAKRLVEQNKAAVVFCPHSGGVFAIQAFNQQEGFLLAAYTSVPTVTSRGNTLTLRIPPSFDVYVEPFVQYEMKRFGKKLGMAGGDHEYAKVWAKIIGPAWEKAGGTIVAQNPMSYNKDTDFYSGVSKVLAAQPDVLFVGGASEPTGLVIKQARELGFKGGFVIMDQAKLDEIAKVVGGLDPLDGAIGVLPLSFDDQTPAQDFVKRYRAKYSNDPNTEASLNYTALYVVTGAMTSGKTATEAKTIRAQCDAAAKALPSADNPNEVTGIAANGGLRRRSLGPPSGYPPPPATAEDARLRPWRSAST